MCLQSVNSVKIIFFYNNFKLKFYLPYFLLVNIFTAFMIFGFLKRIGVYFRLKNICSFIRLLKKEIRYNKNLNIVHVKTAGNAEITVKL